MVIVLNETRPTARKEHDCSCCGRTIQRGEEYERQSNIYDGRLYTYKVCAHCQAATSRALKLDQYDYWDEGIDYDYLENALCDFRETLADIRMLIGLRRRWTQRDGTLWPVPIAASDHNTGSNCTVVGCGNMRAIHGPVCIDHSIDHNTGSNP